MCQYRLEKFFWGGGEKGQDKKQPPPYAWKKFSTAITQFLLISAFLCMAIKRGCLSDVCMCSWDFLPHGALKRYMFGLFNLTPGIGLGGGNGGSRRGL